MGRPCRLEELDRPLVVRGRLVRASSGARHRAGALLDVGPHEGIVGQLQRSLEGPLRLEVRG